MPVDWDSYFAQEDDLPLSRLSIRWPEGGGERIWVRKFNGEMVLGNSPLYPKFRFLDVVDGERVKERYYQDRLVFTTPEWQGTEEQRKQLSDAVSRIPEVLLTFFTNAWGYVLVHDPADRAETVKRLAESGFVGEVSLSSFNVGKDEESYEKLWEKS